MPAPPSWISRVYAEERAGNLTVHMTRALTTLATFRGSGGVAWPSHATLADRAHVSVSTVQRALDAAREMGLVAWTERRVRHGWRSLRSSNLYRLMVPLGSVAPSPRTKRQGERGGERTGNKKALMEMLRAAAGLPDLMAARRALYAAPH